MTVYRLTYYHAGNEEEWGDYYLLGYFDSRAEVEKAIAFYSGMACFSIPNFGIYRTEVSGASGRPLTQIYCVELYLHDPGFVSEFREILGVFEEEAEANRCAQCFREDNPRLLASKTLEIELDVFCYTLNERGWEEGYTTG